jgi:uncharacterized protein with PIN domain
VVLTSDRCFVGAAHTHHAFLVTAGTKRLQLGEVLGAFGLRVDREDLLSRCARCNGTFLPDPVPPGALPEGHGVPPRILARHTEFWLCGRCGCVPVRQRSGERGCLAGGHVRWASERASKAGARGTQTGPRTATWLFLRTLCARPGLLRDTGPPPPPRCRSAVYWQGFQYARAMRKMGDLLAQLSLGGGTAAGAALAGVAN